VLTELLSAKYHAGETWNYKTRPGEQGSILTVLRVESAPKLGVIVHVSLTGLKIRNGHSPSGFSGEIGHMPFSEEAIDRSVTTRIGTANALPDFEDGYREWRTGFEKGKAGSFSITVAEAVGYMESTLQQ